MSCEENSFITQLNVLDFSDSTKQLAELKKIIFNIETTNLAKLEFIKEEILKNKYQINSFCIAEKLLEHASIQETIEVAMA